MVFDLSRLDWRLCGWRPYVWKLGKAAETGSAMRPDLGPFPARVPGSVQQALLEAGVLDDWHIGAASRDCEWVEHRHWDYTATVPAGAIAPGTRVLLDAQGLDYSGWILVDAKEVARFAGALLPHRIDLSRALGDGKEHRLSIVFDEPPSEQGQIGYTSRSCYFKPRYNYSWDWCPRFVPIGPWDALALHTGLDAAVARCDARCVLSPDNRSGRVDLRLDAGDVAGTLTAILRDGDRELARAKTAVADGAARLFLDCGAIEPWWPNGMGAARLYALEIELRSGDEVWRRRYEVGFKRVEWRGCEDAPEGAEPWVCVVNGEPVFLQGVNWVPPRVGYHDTTEGEYRRLIDLYADMGCNVLRVWGGAILEKEVFYRLCDEAGLLVWQEFPLSSSGVDNWPPEDPDVIRKLTRIASSYIARRGRHVSLLLWCGGNELLGGGEGPGEDGVPVDYAHPCVGALREVVELEDPGRRFLPTSASGPNEWGLRANFGKGIHHDVHGPWGYSAGCADPDEWRAFWAEDDALFRSEVGMPGACSVDFIKRYADGMEAWPPVTEYWMHTASWWTQWGRLRERIEAAGDGEAALAEYVRLTQAEQAEAYAVAAGASKGRFPRCGGFIVWMGHDCFPCPSNNSVIDYERNPKPAYFALRDVFKGRRTDG